MDELRARPPRQGAAIVANGVPRGNPETTLSLLPAAVMGQWMADNRDAVRGLVLDLGCGNAPYREWYGSLADRVVTYDPVVTDAVEVVGVAERLPFAGEVFDCVFALEVLEHVTDVESAIAEVLRVLKPGGEVLITVPFVYPIHEAPHDYRRFTQFGLQSLLERQGFVVQDLSAKGGLNLLLMHWLLMIVVRVTIRLARPLSPGRLITDHRWVRWIFSVPQLPLVHRHFSRRITGTAAWATLGYMARAKKEGPGSSY